MTAQVIDTAWGSTVRCDGCSLYRPNLTRDAAQRLADDHNVPGVCPAGARGDNPANYRRRA